MPTHTNLSPTPQHHPTPSIKSQKTALLEFELSNCLRFPEVAGVSFLRYLGKTMSGIFVAMGKEIRPLIPRSTYLTSRSTLQHHQPTQTMQTIKLPTLRSIKKAYVPYVRMLEKKGGRVVMTNSPKLLKTSKKYAINQRKLSVRPSRR